MKKLLILFTLFLGISIPSFGQADSVSIVQKISRGLNITADKLKDSIAFYSFAYKLKIIRFNDSSFVSNISVNDSIETSIVKNRSFLKSINYASIMGGRREITLIIPFSVIVTDHNSKKKLDKKISFIDFTTRIENLFFADPKSQALDNFIFFRPMMVYFDKKIYD
jgi:hypothetical protein